MILLFTDYGIDGPYLGQVQAVINKMAPGENVINLLANAPRQNPKAAAYLLASLADGYPDETIFFCVIDPGVGTFSDMPVVLRIDGCWFVGPDNGLFDIVAGDSNEIECWEIHWRPENMSATFHGRDLYAPITAMIANGLDIPGEKFKWQDKNHWPVDLFEIIFIDHFGNCMTGIHAADFNRECTLKVADNLIPHSDTYANVSKGQVFWYQNSNGMVEIAVNNGNASKQLNLDIGTEVTFS